MSEELSFESLNLKKPLEKMTAKELRELVIDKIPQITGASGMDKSELLSAIKEVFGIEEEGAGVSPYKEQIYSIKRQIRDLRAKRQEVSDRKEREKLRKEISKLKKRTRRLAASL